MHDYALEYMAILGGIMGRLLDVLPRCQLLR
jgi:hypothetical protein